MRRVRPFDIFNPSVFFIAFYVVFLLSGTVIQYFDIDYTRLSYSIQNSTVFLIILSYLLLFFLSSYVVAEIAIPGKAFFWQQPIMDLSRQKCIWLSYLYLIISAVSLIIYFKKIGAVPLLMVDVENARAALKIGSGKLIIIGKGFSYVGTYLYCLFYGKTNLRSFFKNFVFWVLLFINVVFLAGTGFRGPSAFLLLSALLFIFFNSDAYYRQRGLSARHVFLGLCFFLLLVAMGFVRQYQEFRLAAFLSVVHVLCVNVNNLNTLVSSIPSTIDYFYGWTFLNDLLMVLPGFENQHISIYIKDTLGLTFPGEGMTITSPGEGYINFGISGVFVHAVLLGLFCGVFYNWATKKNTLSSRMITICVAVGVSRMPQSGFGASFFFTMFPLLLLAIPTAFICRKNYEKNSHLF